MRACESADGLGLAWATRAGVAARLGIRKWDWLRLEEAAGVQIKRLGRKVFVPMAAMQIVEEQYAERLAQCRESIAASMPDPAADEQGEPAPAAEPNDCPDPGVDIPAAAMTTGDSSRLERWLPVVAELAMESLQVEMVVVVAFDLKGWRVRCQSCGSVPEDEQRAALDAIEAAANREARSVARAVVEAAGLQVDGPGSEAPYEVGAAGQGDG